MNKELFERIKTKDALAILVDENENVIWESGKSPVGNLYKYYFRGKLLETGKLTMYANQAGLAMAVLADKINMVTCYAYQVSKPGLELFNSKNVHVEYEELIELVISSQDPTSVCPIEKFLYTHEDAEERWDFLEEKYTGDGPTACCTAK